MSKEVKRYTMWQDGSCSGPQDEGDWVTSEDYDALQSQLDATERALLIAHSDIKVEQRVSANLREHKNEYMDAAEVTRKALLAEIDSLRNALKNARYRIEQGRVWNGMGWTLTGLHSHQQQKALDEIDAALQGEQPCT